MSLPAPNLDDLRFQRDLVDEARKRIVRYCPEWTEYNLSDPGITLIELFAWMTEMIVYRLNQVPEKNYVKFLELLGMQRQPASSAQTDLTFWLSVPLPINPESQENVFVPEGTQVASRRDDQANEVIFTTDRKLIMTAPRLSQIRRWQDFNKNYLSRMGVEVFQAFSQPRPQLGDTFYLGFDENHDIRGHILKLTFECRPSEAVGVRREDPPWIWECSLGNGQWQEVPLSNRPGEKDTTGGLNNERGSLTLYLPLELNPDSVQGRSAFWLRCRLEQRNSTQGMYTESPQIVRVSAFTIGGSIPASHAIVVEDEDLGKCNGEPGLKFKLQKAPVLALKPGETLEIEESYLGEVVYKPWNLVENFSNSSRYDRHFTLDTATGEISLGPAIRQPDGTVRQYGRVPESNRALRVTRYRYGGGVDGNVPSDSLKILTTSLPYIARVTNLTRASGGCDQESLEEVKIRASREKLLPKRAVTADDYEQIARNATRSIGRVKCLASTSEGRPSGIVELLVVPQAAEALRVGDLSHLRLENALKKELVDYLDQYRLLTSTVHVREPRYQGVKITARIVCSEFGQPEQICARVLRRVNAYLTPLPVAASPEDQDEMAGPDWQGWPFGRDLFAAEILSLIQRVPGVRYVLDVQISTRAIDPHSETAPDDPERNPASLTLTPLNAQVLPLPDDSLICSLEHEIIPVSLEDLYKEKKG
jgi:predicted phage baseplate assembly protein